jgi:hypothetical protein
MVMRMVRQVKRMRGMRVMWMVTTEVMVVHRMRSTQWHTLPLGSRLHCDRNNVITCSGSGRRRHFGRNGHRDGLLEHDIDLDTTQRRHHTEGVLQLVIIRNHFSFTVFIDPSQRKGSWVLLPRQGRNRRFHARDKVIQRNTGHMGIIQFDAMEFRHIRNSDNNSHDLFG